MSARLHHYLPRCYLKGFTATGSKSGRLFVIDGRTRRTFVTSPANVAVERDFLRFDVEGYPPDSLENQMSKFEGEVNKALALIIDTHRFDNSEDRAHLFNLMALLAVRQPVLRDEVKRYYEDRAFAAMKDALSAPEQFDALMQAMVKEGTLKPEEIVPYEQMKERFKPDDYIVSVPKLRHIQNELRAHEKVLPTFFQRRWTLLKAIPGQGYFVTSDRPVVLTWTNPAHRGVRHKLRFGSKASDVIFPVSKELTLLGRFEGRETQHWLDSMAIAGINGAQVDYARYQVYAANNGFRYALEEAKPLPGAGLLKDYRFTTPLGHARNEDFSG